MVQNSSLPPRNGRQSNCCWVGWLPRRTYRSASPVPPRTTTLRVSAPDGTETLRWVKARRAPDRPVSESSDVKSPSARGEIQVSNDDTRPYMPGKSGSAQP
jgi:hypothetical protein